jgi:outer membrane protein OmpA-like peptidoglycan-associated protein
MTVVRKTVRLCAVWLILLLFLFTSLGVADEKGEEDPVPFFKYSFSSFPVTVIEKSTSNLRLYQNGRYIEHVRREEQGRMSISGSGVTGTYYIIEDVVREAVQRGERVDGRAAVSLPVSALPEEWALEDDAFPRIRPLPSLPASLPEQGTVWKEFITIALFPERAGEAVVLPAEIRYRYDGPGTFYGNPVHTVTGFISVEKSLPAGAAAARMEGEHVLTIAFSSDTMLPLFIKDQVDQTYDFSDGGKTAYRGFINHWFGFPGLEKKLDLPDTEDVEVIETDEGPGFRIRELRFKPDKAVLLPGEEARLGRIAEIITETVSGTVLIVGHTASIGYPEGEMKLSVERAARVAEILIQRGVDGDRVLYEGRGSSEPIAGNDTEAGRAQNRRVEIILIDR